MSTDAWTWDQFMTFADGHTLSLNGGLHPRPVGSDCPVKPA
jgi:hypothetical protein